jgi:Dolichyl-phosphate-mannose-protein mannosyltransferase
VAATLLVRLPLLGWRNYDPDELQHLHAAYSIARGLVPYRDFFEHHPPLLHYALAPLVAAFDVSSRTEDAFAVLTLARGAMWLATLAILWLAYRLGRRLFEPRAALLGVALLSTCVLFFDKTMEVRPDVPGCAALMAALLWAVRAQQDRLGFGFLLSGVASGIALLFTPKLAFALLGMLAGLGLSGAPLIALLAWSAGLAAPIAVVLLTFLSRGALGAFVECNLLVNLRWRARFGPERILREDLLLANPGLCALAVVGLALLLLRARLPEGRRRGLLVLALSGAAGFGGLWLVPVPWHQYYLSFLPAMGLMAGFGLARVADRLAGESAARRRLSEVAAALALVGLSLPLLQRVRGQLGPGNLDKRASLRFVIENTAPDETVLDGYTGIGVFRPHAWRYFFLHAELRRMLGEAERRELLLGLRSGRIAPRLISYDGHSTRVSPEVTAFFDRHYEPVGQGPIRARLFPPSVVVWDDDAPRPLARPERPVTSAYVLVGDGWGETEEEAGVRFRRSRGRLSILILPVAQPRAGWLVLRARAGSGVTGLGFEAVLNRASLGTAVPGTAWGDHAFEVPEGALRRGLNRLALRYSTTPNRAQPGHGGPNAVVAVESVRLEPR